MQNIVTWGQNMSSNIEEFVCISMEGLFSGVPPSTIMQLPVSLTQVTSGTDRHLIVDPCNGAM